MRIIAFVTICLVAAAGVSIYLIGAHNKQQQQRDTALPVAQTSVEALSAAPRIVFRNTSLHDGYGDVAMVSLADPSGPRAMTGTACDRVYATPGNVLCLASDRGIVTTYTAKVLDDEMSPTQDLPLTGIPSRARLSRDGKLAATTSFVAGDSYASTSFSTRTVISTVGGGTIGDLEDFTLIHDGQVIQPVDRNFWGVTFADDDNTFYATAKFGGSTWLVHGDIAAKTLITMQSDAECPSLSPNGQYLVYKQRADLPLGKWRLVRYEIATGTITPLAEKNSVDDQVEWLDDSHVMYGLPRSGAEASISDVWVVPADGTGTPSVLVPQAWSPAVVHGAAPAAG